MYRLFVGLLIVGPVTAAPIEVGEIRDGWKSLKPWEASGAAGRLLPAGKNVVAQVEVPPLGDKESEVGGKWFGIISAEIYGAAGANAGRVMVEAIDIATGEAFATGQAKVETAVPKAVWSIIVSSEMGNEKAANAFDGDPDTMWHCDADLEGSPGLHWIGVEFGKPARFGGIRYLPRQAGSENGSAREYRLEIRKPGGGWETALEGEALGTKDRKALELPLKEPVSVEAFRFVIVKDWGDGFGAAAEIEPIGLKLPPLEPVRPTSRAWAEISHELVSRIEGKTIGLRVRNSPDSDLVVGDVHFSRVHPNPSGALFGRSNGGLGPDKLGAGLLGFDALTEHKQTALGVMTFHKKSAARSAGLREGDWILAVAGKPLPVNDLAPGWNWLRNSHEAFIGHETEAALKAGKKTLALTVMRKGELVDLSVPLRRDRAFTTMNPLDDREAAAMLADMLKFLEDTQRDDGSWSGDMIRTSLSSLALMATGEPRHRSRVKRAVDWAQNRFKKPDDYGNLGFWAGAYAGMLYAEWHLATGDRSVLKNMEDLRDWAANGSHKSAWEVPALGHGPDGLPYEQKALVAPACHLLVFEALAKRCGMESKIWELLMPYMEMAWSDPKEGGHGSLGYNRSYKDTGEFWSRTGLFAMAAHLRDERMDMRDAMVGFMSKSHPWLRNSHAYGEPGGALGLLALNLVQPDDYLKVIRQYDWWFSLAWEPGYGLRFTTPHMGAPYMGEDDLINAAYALVLQGPKRNLHIHGATDNGLWRSR